MEFNRSLTHRSIVLALAVASATAVSVLPSSTAQADPSPAEAARTVSELGVKLNATNEQLNTATELLKASRAKQAKLQQDIKLHQTKAAAYEKRVGEIAAAAYRGGRISMFNSVLAGGSPQTVLDQLNTLDVVSKDDKAQIQSLIRAKKPLNEAKKKLDREVGLQATQEKTLRERKVVLDKDMAKWRVLAARQPATRPASRANRSSGVKEKAPAYTGGGSGRGATVVKFAYAQIGKPYVFGAGGPGSYDCSGLTQRAWAQVGVGLPHSSRLQYQNLRRVSKSSIVPGDLISYYPGSNSHVAIYAGGGKVIHAPQPGESVKISNIDDMPYAGAMRP